MKNKFFLTAIFLAILLAGCGRIGSVPQPTAVIKDGHAFLAIKDPQKMTHRTLAVYLPADWQEVKSQMNLYYLPPGISATNTAAEKIIVAVYSIPPEDHGKLADFMGNDFSKGMYGINNLKDVAGGQDTKLGKLEAREEKYEGNASGTPVQVTQIDARSNNLLYKFGHYCPKDSCRYGDIFAEMAASFEFIPQ
jgi:hypothetical protein